MKYVKQAKVENRKVKYRGREIGSPIPSAFPVAFIEFDDRIVVEYRAESKSALGERNVFAFGADGNVIWQIESYHEKPVDLRYQTFFVELRFEIEEHITYANTWSGHQVKINVEDGSIERIDVGRPW